MSVISDVTLLAYDALYQKSPILLKNGLASQLISQAASLVPSNSFITSNQITSKLPSVLPLAALFYPIAGFSANGWAFRPESGAEIYRSEISQYAFYDASTAANSTTKEPLRFEFTLELPTNGLLGMAAQLPIMETMKAMLENHRNLGGVFACLMPIGYYDNCILKDVKTTQSQADTKQLQPALVFTFEQPIITTTEAKDMYNNMIKRLGGSVGKAG